MPALKTGNVEAVTWPTVYGIAVGYHKEAPHVTVTNHVHQIGTVLVSAKTWGSLDEKEQGWIREAAKEIKGLRKSVRGAEAAATVKENHDRRRRWCRGILPQRGRIKTVACCCP